MADAYRIEDEPSPGALARWAVNPLWPLLAVMLGGAWIGWPWFVLNGLAVGSPTSRREVGWVLAGFAGSAALAALLVWQFRLGVLDQGSVRYAYLVLVVWKLGVSYVLYTLQARTFELYQHYGGHVANGVFVVVLALLLGGRLEEALFVTDFLMLVMS